MANEVTEEPVSSKTGKDCWSKEVIEEPPSLIKDRWVQVFAFVYAEANSSKKPDIRPEQMSGVVSGHSLVVILFPHLNVIYYCTGILS